jgi:hypothetical protein
MVHDTGKFTDSEMIEESVRLKTFDKWPVHFISKNELAASSFYFESNDNWVRCAFCGVQLWGWQPDDDLLICHHYSSRHCRAAKGGYTRNVPIGSDDL